MYPSGWHKPEFRLLRCLCPGPAAPPRGWEEVAEAVDPQAEREEWGAGRCSDASPGSLAAGRHVKVCLIIAGVFMAWLAGG